MDFFRAGNSRFAGLLLPIMCTVVMLRRPKHDWPLIIGANRDEMIDRPWLGPARHWPDRTHVTAGIDELAGGTWLAMNDDGVVASILNRQNSLGPAENKRSRGELPLEAVDHAEAKVAAKALAGLDPSSYRSFNLVIADARQAFWLRSTGEGDSSIDVMEIPAGVSMVTAYDMNDLNSPRIQTHLSRFQNAPPPDPDTDDWFTWQTLLSSKSTTGDKTGRAAMNVTTRGAFGTICSSLIALPRPGQPSIKAKWQFCAGRPDEHPYQPVEL